MPDMIGTGQLARRLRSRGYAVTVNYIDRLVSNGALEPTAAMSGRRLWDTEAVEQVTELLDQRGRGPASDTESER